MRVNSLCFLAFLCLLLPSLSLATLSPPSFLSTQLKKFEQLEGQVLGASGDVACAGNLDIVLALDSSGSVGAHFPSIRNFAENVVDFFGPTHENVHVGVVQFSGQGQARVEMRLTGNKDNLILAIRSMELIGGLTSITEGLEYAYDEVKLHARETTTKIIVFVTDGRNTNATNESTVKIANTIKNERMRIFGFGVGSGTDHVFNRELVTQPDDQHYWEVANFTQLEEMNEWMKQACTLITELKNYIGPVRGDSLVKVHGLGFSNVDHNDSASVAIKSLNLLGNSPNSMMQCRFYNEEEDVDERVKGYYKSEGEVHCRAPKVKGGGKTVYVELSQDGGFSWTNNKQKFTYYRYHFWWWMPIPILLFMLLVCVYWCCAPCPVFAFIPVTWIARLINPAPPVMPAEPVAPGQAAPMGTGAGAVGQAGKKKWDKLSPTEYLWTATGGGIKKMNVDWGDRGQIDKDKDYLPTDEWGEDAAPEGEGGIAGFFSSYRSGRRILPEWCPSFCP